MFTFLRRAAWVLPALGTLWASTLRAEPCSPISRENLVRCALSRGLEARVAEANVQAATARVTASDPWLPQNPALTLTAAQRRAAGESALNWSASLAIELEVAGQRGARRASAQADREAQQRLLSASARSTAAAALRAYFGTLAARDARAVLERLAAASQRAF